jgi:hypothetical protein
MYTGNISLCHTCRVVSSWNHEVPSVPHGNTTCKPRTSNPLTWYLYLITSTQLSVASISRLLSLFYMVTFFFTAVPFLLPFLLYFLRSLFYLSLFRKWQNVAALGLDGFQPGGGGGRQTHFTQIWVLGATNSCINSPPPSCHSSHSLTLLYPYKLTKFSGFCSQRKESFLESALKIWIN